VINLRVVASVLCAGLALGCSAAAPAAETASPSAIATLVASAAASTPAAAPVRELINPGASLAAASRYGDLVFAAGHLVDDPGADFQAHVGDVLDSLEATLEASGAGLDTLLMVHVYLADWNDWEAFDAAYVRRMRQYGTPPRATVEVARLGWDAPIEISAIAHVRARTP